MSNSNCHKCGATDAPSRCSACRQVYYCSRECQRADWKEHKKWCQVLPSTIPPNPTTAADADSDAHPFVFLEVSPGKGVYYISREFHRAAWKEHNKWCQVLPSTIPPNPTTAADADSDARPFVFLEVSQGEGNGLTNHVKGHLFHTKQDGLAFATKFFQSSIGGPFRSPFSELLGWKVEIYCNSRTNTIYPPGSCILLVYGNRIKGINAAGVYLGCDVHSGISKLNNIDGPIFVTGRNSAGEFLSQSCLWGILNFIWDCMDLYGSDEDDDPQPVIRRWAKAYKAKTWQPRGGDGGIPVYDTNPLSGLSSRMRSVQDHRSSGARGSGSN